jgi:uncharacterized membrane protein
MIKSIFLFLGVSLITLAIILLKNGNFPTSGLMLLTVGILIILTVSTIKFNKAGHH